MNQRCTLKLFNDMMNEYLKINDMRYSDQRERLLKYLYTQDEYVAIEDMYQEMNTESIKTIGYATISRHINFFHKMGWIHSIRQPYKAYKLISNPLSGL